MGKFTAAKESDSFKPTDYVGSLLYVEVLAEADEMTTDYGTMRPVRANIAVLDGPGKGEVFEDALIFNGSLRNYYRTKLGRTILGRLGRKAPTKPGNTPGYAIQPPSAADEKLAVAHEAEQGPSISGDDEPPF